MDDYKAQILLGIASARADGFLGTAQAMEELLAELLASEMPGMATSDRAGRADRGSGSGIASAA